MTLSESTLLSAIPVGFVCCVAKVHFSGGRLLNLLCSFALTSLLYSRTVYAGTAPLWIDVG